MAFAQQAAFARTSAAQIPAPVQPIQPIQPIQVAQLAPVPAVQAVPSEMQATQTIGQIAMHDAEFQNFVAGRRNEYSNALRKGAGIEARDVYGSSTGASRSSISGDWADALHPLTIGVGAAAIASLLFAASPGVAFTRVSDLDFPEKRTRDWLKIAAVSSLVGFGSGVAVALARYYMP